VGMASERLNKIHAEINAALEKLEVTKDPIERRKRLLALRILIADLDKLAAKSIGQLPRCEHSMKLPVEQ
jgi:hypothetical protein